MVDLLILLIFVTLIFLIGTVVVFAYVSGFFTSIDVAISSDLPYLKDGSTIYYKINKGSYYSLGSLFTETYCVAPKLIQFGLHYDDPEIVPEDECRSAIGVLVNEKENKDIIEELEKNGFKKKILPSIEEGIYASFPHISFLSIGFGLSKVILLLRSYFKKMDCKEFTFLEIYDDDTIHYIGITKDADDFLVEDFYLEENDEIVKITQSDIEAVTEEGKEKAE
ncbi:unnamed protein product [Rodentolepis nana]|uniref:Testis-expressed sequence 264 protein n=1 Tax=Rodentolepis nana TaxID=102285 RepID=A0A0R3TL35_RODNA|nr:unnamed protein product [Rodentolepis nana]